MTTTVPRAAQRARSPALLGAAALCAVTAFGCDDEVALPDATQADAEREVQQRMASIKHCWSAGDKKKSWLVGEVQTLHIDVNHKGRVRVTFAEPANNKHPVGACVRSALDGLRFAPPDAPQLLQVPVRLGRPSQAPAPAP